MITNKDFNSNDVYDIGVGTTKEDELFDYADISSYYKTKKDIDRGKNDDFEISLQLNRDIIKYMKGK